MSEAPSATDQSLGGSSERGDAAESLYPPEAPREDSRVPSTGLLEQRETSSEDGRNMPRGDGNEPGGESLDGSVNKPGEESLNGSVNKPGESLVEVSSALPTDRQSFESLAKLAVLQSSREVTCESQAAEDTVIPHFPENVGRVVMKKNSDSLKNLRLYSSSDSDSCKDAEVTDFMADKDWQIDSNDSSDIEFFECDDGDRNKSSRKGEGPCFNPLGEDLSMLPMPDLSKLVIDCDKEEFLLMGEVRSIIVDIVTIHALPNTPAYDLDTILFVEQNDKKLPLGAIVDVIGPVTGPIYCVRIDIGEDHGLSMGTKVYAAPKSDLTHYVFVKELMKIKGSDASWLHDQEMPPEVAGDSSGEEEEPEQPRQRQRKRQRNSPERHLSFERSMNQWNTLNTRATRLADTIQEYNSGRSGSRFIGNRIVSPRPFVPTPRIFTPYLQTFISRPHNPFYPRQGNPNRYPGPSRPF